MCVRAASAFLVFASPREVREVVKRLPKVGTGAEYDLPQSRSAKTPPPPSVSLSLSPHALRISSETYMGHL